MGQDTDPLGNGFVASLWTLVASCFTARALPKCSGALLSMCTRYRRALKPAAFTNDAQKLGPLEKIEMERFAGETLLKFLFFKSFTL
jgi:hypothetical protein